MLNHQRDNVVEKKLIMPARYILLMEFHLIPVCKRQIRHTCPTPALIHYVSQGEKAYMNILPTSIIQYD